MDESLLQKVRSLEAELDEALARRSVYGTDANASLGLATNIEEVAAARQPMSATDSQIARGMAILAPRLVSGAGGRQPAVRALVHDLTFAGHYYMLRDYLYYTYNVPGALNWSFSRDRVEARFADPTVPRQFFTAFNETLLSSIELFGSFEGGEEVEALLRGEPEGVETDRVRQAYALIEQEVALKLRGYFSILDGASRIDLGGYTYAQFTAVYGRLLGKALYHRYFARVNKAIGAVFIPQDELVEAFGEDLGLPPHTSELILKDIVFDTDAIATRTDAAYFSLLREGAPPRRIVMRPHHFAISEGLVGVLRVIAQRRPRTFLTNVSAEMGRAFVRRVKRAFEEQGFWCRSEMSLQDFDPTLPDIDLLVISEEPTLGYVVLICELKSPIPPRWAKDQLKVLNRDGVSKAFRQAEAIRKFLATDEGVRFIRGLLPDTGIPHFDGFVVAIQHLVITSDNAGMFFGAESTPVISFRTLERLLRRSDGDMAFIQHVLNTYNEHADRALRTEMVDFRLNGRAVVYEGVTTSAILNFPTVQWRSSPERQAMIDEFIASGAHPFDVFHGLDRHRRDEEP